MWCSLLALCLLLDSCTSCSGVFREVDVRVSGRALQLAHSTLRHQLQTASGGAKLLMAFLVGSKPSCVSEYKCSCGMCEFHGFRGILMSDDRCMQKSQNQPSFPMLAVSQPSWGGDKITVLPHHPLPFWKVSLGQIGFGQSNSLHIAEYLKR